MMLRSNLICNHSMMRRFIAKQLTFNHLAISLSMNSLWGGRFEKCYTDIRVFNPLAISNSGPNFQSVYWKHEPSKNRAYESRFREVEHSSFTPLVFSASGGMGYEATIFTRGLPAYYLKSGRNHMLLS